ncbi:beta-propeller domain-containing protein [Jiangella gansuensis]|uniref:beta-propeller domain-containing protein n=1 Tax=Jiangella gansuensis TaxID=281473 RepID=UPI0004B9091E|nr:beta-propeller domain-containing protein [Jiangella gansuensis]
MIAGCSVDSDDDAGPVAVMGLTSFDACADVLDHLKSEAHDRVGPWGLDSVGIAYAGRADALESEVAAGDASGGPQSAPDHSTTNVQEAGVDEPDVAKTDGRLLVTTSGGDLRIVDVTGDVPREVGRLGLMLNPDAPEYGHLDATLLLDGDRVVVFVREYPWIAFDGPATSSLPYGPMGPYRTAVLLVDISDPAVPTIMSTLRVDGSHLDARMVDDTVRLVVSSAPSLAFPMDEGDWDLPQDELTERNRAVVAESTIEDWLPSYEFTRGGDDAASGQLVDCERLSRPDEFAGFSTLSVLTFDPADGLTADGTVGVLTDGDTVYASPDRLYVATTRWGDPIPVDPIPLDPAGTASDVPDAGPPLVTTGIHAFDIAGDAPAGYLASGEVDGRIIGRYAMSEFEGVLRVATTLDSWSGGSDTSESQLVTLEQRDTELVELGRVGGLGKGEQIYAVRYFGATGYVVTFRQVDPLYVLDLADPAAPAVTGELKITGYSAYLHAVGEDRLLGVGQEATAQGQTVGTQVSLFDVGDPAAPAKLDGHVVPDTWAQTEHDPQAFLHWPDTGQAVVPIDGMTGSSALVVQVGDDTVAEQGTVTRAEPAPDGYAQLRRTLVVGDELYTVWQDGIQSNALDDLEPRGWLSFTPSP